MKRKILKTNLIDYGYKTSTIKAIMCGIRKPSYEAMIVLNKRYKIPFTAWVDIKSYINNTTNKEPIKSLRKEHS